MVVTTRLRLDSVASSTRNAKFASEVIVGDQIVAAEGYVLAVRILEDKSTYNTVEDLTGRMVSLRAGDVLAACSAPAARSAATPASCPGHRRRRHDQRPQPGRHPRAAAPPSTPNRLAVPGRGAGRRAELPRAGDRVGRPAHIRDRAVPRRPRSRAGAGGLRRRDLHERRQDRGRQRAGARLARGGLRVAAGQAHRRLADARRALACSTRGHRRAHLQRRRRGQHAGRASPSPPPRESSSGSPRPSPT